MRKFAEKLAAQPLWFQNAYLSSALQNYVNSGNFAEYYQTLTNFDYLEVKIKRPEFGLDALIADYDLVDESKVATHSDDYLEKVKALKLIQGALRLSAHILAEDKTQLAGQLLGRLLSFSHLEIQGLLAQAKQWQDYPWLRPLSPSLTPPGGRLLRTLARHRDWVRAVALTSDGNRVISASFDSTLKVWDLADGKIVTNFTTDSPVSCFAVTPDGMTIMVGDISGQIHFLQLETGKGVDCG